MNEHVDTACFLLKQSKNILTDKEMELVSMLMQDSRNGYNHKNIISDYGESNIAIPRDRNGQFEPKVLEKWQTRTNEIEQKILAMYAKGMSQRDIESNLRDIYGAEIPQTLISKITDKILPEVNEWQNRPLESIYPIIYFDGIVFKSRKDSQIINKCVYTVLGIDMEGQKDILGIWISENESATFYASICSDLKKRGVSDIYWSTKVLDRRAGTKAV
jgi:putative transposase